MADKKVPARLIFEDGTTFEGWMCGADKKSSGVADINTEVVGYQEIITNPLNKDKILVMTMPQIGNYGVNSQDVSSPDVVIAGLVVREMCYEPSNWRSERSLPELLKASGVAALDGVDTRAVTLYLRDNPGAAGRIELQDVEVN